VSVINQNFYHWLVGYLDGRDPVNLVSMSGCPPREYEPEAMAIWEALPSITSADEASKMVYAVFLKYFDSAAIVGPFEPYVEIGEHVYSAWERAKD
jgi:hypothetical protein